MVVNLKKLSLRKFKIAMNIDNQNGNNQLNSIRNRMIELKEFFLGNSTRFIGLIIEGLEQYK